MPDRTENDAVIELARSAAAETAPVPEADGTGITAFRGTPPVRP